MVGWLLGSVLIAAGTHGVQSSAARCRGAMPTAIVIRGTMTEQGSTGSFERTVDLVTGFHKTVRNNGVSQSIDGFNGMTWGFGNGILNVIDVPPLMPDSAAGAFIARLGWNDRRAHPSKIERTNTTLDRVYDLPRMSPVTVVWTPNSRQPLRATIDADRGTASTTFSDWRCVDGIRYPFAQSETNAMGETQTLTVTSIVPAHVTMGTFSPPRPVAHGHITGSAPVSFRYSGKRDRHIIVDSTINGVTLPLIFDSGGRNYLSPESAKIMGLTVTGGTTLTGVGSGSTAGGLSTVPTWAIGSATLENEVSVVAPLPWPETPGSPVGISGFEFLAEFRTTIDYPNMTMSFANFSDSRAPDGVELPLATDGHSPMIKAYVDGVPGWFGVDTGDQGGITIFKNFAARAHITTDPTLPQSGAAGVGGGVKMGQTRLREFSIGNIHLANPRARLSEATAGAFASRSLGGNLGNGLFHCFRLTFDYQRRVMLLSSDASTDACLRQLTFNVE